MTETLTPDELRTLFLFEGLTEDQLRWLSAQGSVEHIDPGVVFAEGDPATCFYVLVDGELALYRRVGQDDVQINRTSHRGAYMGATQAYLDDDAVDKRYTATMRAVLPSRFFVLPADTFATMMREWFPMAMHLLEGLFFGMRSTTAVVGQRERLLALGALSAGLTHELNNPAAAAVRATAALRERVTGMRRKLAAIADGKHLPPEALHVLVELQEEAVERTAKGVGELSPLETSDREDVLSDWLDEHGVRGGYEIAPVLVAGGLDAPWLDDVLDRVGADVLDAAVHWLRYSIETESLMAEIEDSVHRISGLVGAAKQYSQLDRAPFQSIDLHDGLDSTLVMLTSKLKGVHVVKEYDRSLPAVPAYAGELNQVWTNLVDNAAAAMGGSGTLTVRTSRDDGHAVVEVTDTGSGIPADIVSRIFEPFFTTKAIGEGTGLGLDITWKIVVNRHRGDVRVASRPGETTFTVRLPLVPPPTEPVEPEQAP